MQHSNLPANAKGLLARFPLPVSLSQFATSLAAPLLLPPLLPCLPVLLAWIRLARLSASQSGRPPFYGHVHLSAEWKPTPTTMTTTTAELLAPATHTRTHTQQTYTHTALACYAFVFHCRMSNFSGESTKSRIVLASSRSCSLFPTLSLSLSHTPTVTLHLCMCILKQFSLFFLLLLLHPSSAFWLVFTGNVWQSAFRFSRYFTSFFI